MLDNMFLTDRETSIQNIFVAKLMFSLIFYIKNIFPRVTIFPLLQIEKLNHTKISMIEEIKKLRTTANELLNCD